MLDGLLGRKFSAKCKQSIKCTKSRIVLISRKKQAMLNFLKKDVADLLANGHETNALGRMDALMIEINKIFCYDMIENFCERLLSQISSLQKQRECPQEEMEAVATLIFSAARFSDLPELGDLRHAFIGRYGSAFESSVNAEFVEKIAAKTFSKDKKLKLMQEISEEYSIPWDFRFFGQKRPNLSVSDQSGRTDMPICNAEKVSCKPVTMRKGAASDIKQNALFDIGKQELAYDGRTDPPLEHVTLKQETHAHVKEVHMIPNPKNSFLVNPDKRTKNAFSDEPECRMPHSSYMEAPDIKSRIIRKGSNLEDQHESVVSVKKLPKAQEGWDACFRDRDMMKNTAPCDKPKGYNNGLHTFDYDSNSTRCYKSTTQDMPTAASPKKHLAEEMKSHHRKEELDDVCQATELKMNHDRTKGAAFHVKPKGYPSGIHAVDNNENVNASDMSKSQHGLYSSASEKQVHVSVKHGDGKGVNMIPPYVKSKEPRSGFSPGELQDDDIGFKQRNQQDSDHLAREKQAILDGNPPVNAIPPPYVRSAAKENGMHVGSQTEYHKVDETTVPENDAYLHGISDGNNGYRNLPIDDLVSDKKPKPRSVRRKHPKEQMSHNHIEVVSSNQPVGIQILSERRPDFERRVGAVNGEDYDEEEMAMDKLLMHYSRKGLAHHTSKSRKTKSVAHTIEGYEVAKHKCYDKDCIDNTSAYSSSKNNLPPCKPTIRSSRCAKDTSSTSSWQLPDCDELTARFNALRNGK